MKVKDLIFKKRTLVPSKAFKKPNFESKTVLARSHWDFVEMYLKRSSREESLYYWKQAQAFYNAALYLPAESSPLTLYYCFLNATKALLVYKNQLFSKQHGVTGRAKPGNTNLKNELVLYKSGGIAAALGNYFEDQTIESECSLWALLHNLVFVHRSFCLTYPSESVDLFIPLENPRFVISDFQNYCWFCAETNKAYENQHALNRIQDLGFHIDGSFDRFVIRYRKRFKWYHRGEKRGNNFERLLNYQKKIRKNLVYISGNKTLWYIKRSGVKCIINKHPAVIIFGIMHRLSELARYEPLKIRNHLSLKQNWLLTEFINGSADQFIDMISCEITNSNIMKPSIRG